MKSYIYATKNHHTGVRRLVFRIVFDRFITNSIVAVGIIRRAKSLSTVKKSLLLFCMDVFCIVA